MKRYEVVVAGWKPMLDDPMTGQPWTREGAQEFVARSTANMYPARVEVRRS